jgi:ABC-type dipeptide/oligopeptide/nickel transport system permease subunit
VRGVVRDHHHGSPGRDLHRGGAKLREAGAAADAELGSILVGVPGTAITVRILAVNLFGDALRDFLDPKLK